MRVTCKQTKQRARSNGGGHEMQMVKVQVMRCKALITGQNRQDQTVADMRCKWSRAGHKIQAVNVQSAKLQKHKIKAVHMRKLT